jgi:hypothetical protein
MLSKSTIVDVVVGPIVLTFYYKNDTLSPVLKTVIVDVVVGSGIRHVSNGSFE